MQVHSLKRSGGGDKDLFSGVKDDVKKNSDRMTTSVLTSPLPSLRNKTH